MASKPTMSLVAEAGEESDGVQASWSRSTTGVDDWVQGTLSRSTSRCTSSFSEDIAPPTPGRIARRQPEHSPAVDGSRKTTIPSSPSQKTRRKGIFSTPSVTAAAGLSAPHSKKDRGDAAQEPKAKSARNEKPSPKLIALSASQRFTQRLPNLFNAAPRDKRKDTSRGPSKTRSTSRKPPMPALADDGTANGDSSFSDSSSMDNCEYSFDPPSHIFPSKYDQVPDSTIAVAGSPRSGSSPCGSSSIASLDDDLAAEGGLANDVESSAPSTVPELCADPAGAKVMEDKGLKVNGKEEGDPTSPCSPEEGVGHEGNGLEDGESEEGGSEEGQEEDGTVEGGKREEREGGDSEGENQVALPISAIRMKWAAVSQRALLQELANLRQRCDKAESAWKEAEALWFDAESAKAAAESERAEAELALQEERSWRAESEVALSRVRSELSALQNTHKVEMERASERELMLQHELKVAGAMLDNNRAWSIHRDGDAVEEPAGEALLKETEEEQAQLEEEVGLLRVRTKELEATVCAMAVVKSGLEGRLLELECALEKAREKVPYEEGVGKAGADDHSGKRRWVSEEEMEGMRLQWKEQGFKEANEFWEFVQQQTDKAEEDAEADTTAQSNISVELASPWEVDVGWRRSLSWLGLGVV